MIVGLIFGVKVTDVNTPYRLMDNKALKDVVGRPINNTNKLIIKSGISLL